MKPLYLFLLLLCFPLAGSDLPAQTPADKSARDSTQFITGYPLLFYFPETRLGLGGGLVANRNLNPSLEDTRPSNVQLGAAYTLNEQLLLFSFFNLFLHDDRSQISGEVAYYDYFYPYYGLGSDVGDKFENYFVHYPRINLNYDYLFAPGWYAGAGLRFDNYVVDSIEAGGLLDAERPTGFDGSRVAGLVVRLRRDTRDNVYAPRQGLLIEGSVFGANENVVASSNFTRWRLDARAYLPLGERSVLAGQVVYGYTGGDAPFQELQLYGGASVGRGFVAGRFRDRSLYNAQAEVRFPLFWRIGGTAFASAGDVFGGTGRTDDVMQEIKFTFGGGLRFQLNKKEPLNFRADAGVSSDGVNFYLTVGEAF